MADDTCSFDGCDKQAWARSLCGTHYSRWRRRGDVPAKLKQRRGVCSVDGCDTKHQAKGYCDKHYRRWLDHGDPLVVGRPGAKRGANAGTANPQWKGDSCGYQALHLRIAAERGKARNYICECGAAAVHWSFDYTDPNPLFDKLGLPYSTDVNSYSPRCASCHALFDYSMRTP